MEKSSSSLRDVYTNVGWVLEVTPNLRKLSGPFFIFVSMILEIQITKLDS